MKLLTFISGSIQKPGLLFNDKIIDLCAAYDRLKASGKIKSSLKTLPSSMKELIGIPRGESEARKVLGYLRDGGELSADICRPFGSTRLAPPIPDPEKILCLGGNYRKHVEEGNAEPPKNPILFAKFKNALTAHNTAVIKPLATEKLDYEAELAIVIGKYGKNIRPEDAYDHVFGYTIINDISAREIQISDKQWIRAKSFDTFAPTGPCIVTGDEISDPHNLTIKFLLNGGVMQDSNTGNMIFQVPEIVSFISQAFPLEPGDLISTGTPEGVGLYRQPPVFLKEGDRMEVVIEKIGSLVNTVVEEKVSESENERSWRLKPPEVEHDQIF